MGKRSRDKGAAWERAVARLIRERTGLDCQRTAMQARGGSERPDIDGEAVRDWWVEVKVGAKPNPRAALRQALKDESAAWTAGRQTEAGPRSRRCVAICRDNGAGSRPAFDFAVMRFDDWLSTVIELESATKELRELLDSAETQRRAGELFGDAGQATKTT